MKNDKQAQHTLLGRPITYQDFGIDVKTEQPIELVSWDDPRAKMAVLELFHPETYEFVKMLDKCKSIRVVDGGSGETIRVLKKLES